jgi:hypothetical protein
MGTCSDEMWECRKRLFLLQHGTQRDWWQTGTTDSELQHETMGHVSFRVLPVEVIFGVHRHESIRGIVKTLNKTGKVVVLDSDQNRVVWVGSHLLSILGNLLSFREKEGTPRK